MSAIDGNNSSFSRSTTSSTARTFSPTTLTTADFRATFDAAPGHPAITQGGRCTEVEPEPEFEQRLFTSLGGAATGSESNGLAGWGRCVEGPLW